MKLEHFACNVSDPVAMADWYVRHVGMRIVRSGGPPAHARFLADSSGSVLIEIYRNDKAPIPDYAGMDPLELHLAFESSDVDGDCQRLADAGATVVDPPFTSSIGDRLAMLRDPWNLALQLVCRADRMM